jgi:hypothetical protein
VRKEADNGMFTKGGEVTCPIRGSSKPCRSMVYFLLSKSERAKDKLLPPFRVPQLFAQLCSNGR